MWEIHYYVGNPQGPSLFLLPSPLRGKKWEDWSCLILGHSILGSLGGKSAGSHQGRSHPWQRSCGRDLTGKGGSGLKGPPESARASTPKPKSVCLTILCLSPALLTLTGGYPRPSFSGKNQLRALVNGHDKCFNSNPSDGFLACLTGLSRLLQLSMWLFTASPLWETWKA